MLILSSKDSELILDKLPKKKDLMDCIFFSFEEEGGRSRPPLGTSSVGPDAWESS